MAWFAGLRALVCLRTISRAMQRIADDTSAMRRIYEDTWTSEHAPRPRTRPVEIGTMDQDEIDRRWHQQREEAMIESESSP
jgi:hypothetical protein